MVFSSLLFVFLFLPLNLIIYYLISQKYKNHVLLIFSLIFYMWGGPRYLPLILVETLISWLIAKKIEDIHHGAEEDDEDEFEDEFYEGWDEDLRNKYLNDNIQYNKLESEDGVFYTVEGIENYDLDFDSTLNLLDWDEEIDVKDKEIDEKTRKSMKGWMVLECVLMLSILGFFKYTGFFMTNLQLIAGVPEIIPNIVLPIGISFYTFQLLSYVVDVYRGEVEAQKSYWKLLLYASLFHQCIAGPIVRYKTVCEDIDKRRIDYDDVAIGVRRFAIGLAKKAILANGCASVADALIPVDVASVSTSTTLGLWLGFACYMLQIYLDFSAYSDMAIGMGRMVGFHYLENFDYPYIAKSVQDFWRRWHISLSSFFRDYVYIPLGGNRAGTLKYVRNMAVVWFLTGMWHGASWNYILWGIYYFIFLMLEKFVIKNRIPKGLDHVYALVVIFFGWVIFKCENLALLGGVLKGLFGVGTAGFTNMTVKTEFLSNIFFLIIAIYAVMPISKILRKYLYKKSDENKVVAVVFHLQELLVPSVLVILAALALIGDSYNPFLYFRF